MDKRATVVLGESNFVHIEVYPLLHAVLPPEHAQSLYYELASVVEEIDQRQKRTAILTFANHGNFRAILTDSETEATLNDGPLTMTGRDTIKIGDASWYLPALVIDKTYISGDTIVISISMQAPRRVTDD